MIRLLAAQTSKRKEVENSVTHICSNYPWLIPLYAEAIDQIHSSGFQVTIENEVGNCIFSNPEEIIEFCKGRIANYKIPKYVEFLDEFPLNAVGKVQKFKLRQYGEERLVIASR